MSDESKEGGSRDGQGVIQVSIVTRLLVLFEINCCSAVQRALTSLSSALALSCRLNCLSRAGRKFFRDVTSAMTKTAAVSPVT